jgi:Raf kinase inhibitor-like YbhB/YbcL family protein
MSKYDLKCSEADHRILKKIMLISASKYIIISEVAIVRKITVFILFFVNILGLVYLFAAKPNEKAIKLMRITSPAFQNDSKIPSKYSCDGAGVNPPLIFSNVPVGTKSLVLIVDDPDAPMGTFVHWVLFNIDPETTEIRENSIPQSTALGKNSTGETSFVGACPPSGIHRYFFKIYALNTMLNLNNPDKATLEKEMQDHILEKAELIGLYSKEL